MEVWFQDEARFGQQGKIYRIWARKNTRPKRLKQCGFEFCYILGAVNPVSGKKVGLLFSTIDSDVFNIHLKMISRQLKEKRHALVIIDNAGFHRAKNVKVPKNITLLRLPPYSPELNPVERIWAWLKSHYIGNRVFEGFKDMLEIGCLAWGNLSTRHVKSICRTSWLPRTC